MAAVSLIFFAFDSIQIVWSHAMGYAFDFFEYTLWVLPMSKMLTKSIFIVSIHCGSGDFDIEKKWHDHLLVHLPWYSTTMIRDR